MNAGSQLEMLWVYANQYLKIYGVYMNQYGIRIQERNIYDREYNGLVAGQEWKEDLRTWNKKLEKSVNKEPEEEPPPKEFVPKNPNLTILEDYPRVLGKEYWDVWEGNDYKPTEGSMIDHIKLLEVADRLELKEKAKVQETADMLEHGANLGISGEGRWPSEGDNNKSVYEFGSRVADSLQTALKEGIMFGPFERHQLPWEVFKCSPMTVRLKPNGAARIIMDLSYPHDVRLGEGMVCSPNMGMEEFEEFEPVSMTGDSKWRRCMHRAGRPAAFLKADWDMAYKHVSVRTEDHHLQVVEFCGRYFVEKCLTFGGGNSPTLYHLPASLLKTMAEVETGMDPRQNVMQLDDNCATDRLGSARLTMYGIVYRELAEEMGIRLASEDNPAKAFPPSVRGEVLGLIYDGVKWTWEIPEGKSTRLLVLLGKSIREGKLLNVEAMQLAGKLNHYSNLVGGQFERCLLIHLVKDKAAKKEEVTIGKQARSQMVWWLLNLRALELEGKLIPDPDRYFQQGALVLYPDAAGGASSDGRKGWGCCHPGKNEYARRPWPAYILKNYVKNGETWGKRLTILEGFGAAQVMVIWAEEIVEAGAVAIMVDNSGFCWAHARGCSRCEYIYTLAKFIEDMSVGMGVQAKVFHTGRRTSSGERVADALSKGKMDEVEMEMPGARDVSARSSKVLLKWLEEPRVDRALGRKGLMEISRRCDVVQGRDYIMDMQEILGKKLLG